MYYLAAEAKHAGCQGYSHSTVPVKAGVATGRYHISCNIRAPAQLFVRISPHFFVVLVASDDK